MENLPEIRVIDRFVEEYSQVHGSYVRIAEHVGDTIRKLLQANGIMAIVSARAKSPDRLRGKLERMEAAAGKPYDNLEEIQNAVHDLVGARIALYFPADTLKIRNLLQTHFLCTSAPKVFPPRVSGYEALVAEGCTAHKRKIYPGYEGRRFDGYHAVHQYIQLKAPLSEGYPNPVIEVQVASVLMHAWSEVEHDLAYKKMTGAVSREEYECLDEINGLVIAGEIALNRLHQLSKQRIRMLSVIDSPYSLMLYLTDWLEQKTGGMVASPEEDMSNVKQLFEMYREAEMLSPELLEPELKRLGGKVPENVTQLVKMLIDRFFDGNKKKAKQVTVDNIMQYLDSEDAFYTSAKLGLYLGKWSALEDLTRKAVRSLGYKCSNSAMSWKYVVEERVLPEHITEVYYTLRLQRNAIVHTNRLPDEERFDKLLRDMEWLSNTLKAEFSVK